MTAQQWDRLVDIVTVIWLAFFFIDLANPAMFSDTILWVLLSVFIADLGIKYRRVGNPKTFVKKHWLDILMIIPYVRILRVIRLIRLLRIIRTARIARVGKFPGLKRIEVFRRKTMRLVKRFRTDRSGS